MSNNTPTVSDFSQLKAIADFTQFMELRMENDASGNPIYVGYSNDPAAPVGLATWFIVKLTYDANNSPTRQQLPNYGVKFVGIWNDRATYF